jgi:hypothetical protein
MDGLEILCHPEHAAMLLLKWLDLLLSSILLENLCDSLLLDT